LHQLKAFEARIDSTKAKIAESATLCDCGGGYALPAGLIEGEVVKLLNFDNGTCAIQFKDGRQFQVASPCVVPVPSEFYASYSLNAGTIRRR
jgi:hypothetical protein